MKKLWMWIDTSDEFMLPLYVCDTIYEMADKSGSSTNTIWSTWAKYKSGERKKARFIRVEIDDDEV